MKFRFSPIVLRLKAPLLPIARAVRTKVREVEKDQLPRINAWKAWWRFRAPAAQRKHGLDFELIVSLTSYPPRYATLALTLKTLLTQETRPDRVVLWLTLGDERLLPKDVLSLRDSGLEIHTWPDNIASYTKIVPALARFPLAGIVTADDDTYYPSNWLSSLLAAWDGDLGSITCLRAHRIRFAAPDVPLPYNQWEFLVRGETKDLFPTGVGGVLYPPGALPPETQDRDLFMRLAPRADDVWLFWMGRRAGAKYRKAPGRNNYLPWISAHQIGLSQGNVIGNANDEYIRAMLSYYGWPG